MIDRPVMVMVGVAAGAAAGGLAAATFGARLLGGSPPAPQIAWRRDAAGVKRYSGRVLEPLRRVGDPAADALIERYAERRGRRRTDAENLRRAAALYRKFSRSHKKKAKDKEPLVRDLQHKLELVIDLQDRVRRARAQSPGTRRRQGTSIRALEASLRTARRESDRALKLDSLRELQGSLMRRTLLRRHLDRDIRAWANKHGRLPPRLDQDRLDAAARFFQQNGFEIALILSTSALLEAYACKNGAAVLTRSGGFSANTSRRLAETLQFVLHVQSPGAFRNGTAVDAILRIRLLHAVVRYRLRNGDFYDQQEGQAPQPGVWNEAERGIPLCAEDLLGTLMCFSAIVIRDLPKLGVAVTARQAEDHLYLWRVVGGMLGARTNLLPRDMTEAYALITAIKRRQQQPSEDGVKVAQTLLDFHRELIPGERFDGIAVATMRRLAGDQVCNLVGLPAATVPAIAGSRAAVVFHDRFKDFWAEILLSRGDLTIDGEKVRGYQIPQPLRRFWESQRPGWKRARANLNTLQIES